jgi:hypothetical protein
MSELEKETRAEVDRTILLLGVRPDFLRDWMIGLRAYNDDLEAHPLKPNQIPAPRDSKGKVL